MTVSRLLELIAVVFTASWILVAHAMETESRISKLEVTEESLKESVPKLADSINNLALKIEHIQDRK